MGKICWCTVAVALVFHMQEVCYQPSLCSITETHQLVIGSMNVVGVWGALAEHTFPSDAQLILPFPL